MGSLGSRHPPSCACSICRAGDYVAPHQIIGRAIAAREQYERLFAKLLAGGITCRRERRTLYRLHRSLTGVALSDTLKTIARGCSHNGIRVRVRL